MTALTAPVVRVKAHRQTAAEQQAVYDYVTARDRGICLAARLDPSHVCEGPIQRHHSGLSIGMAKITDARHVTLLCRGANCGAWARVWDRAVMAHLADVEDLRERARFEMEEDARA